MKPGDYVLATKYDDGDFGDHWCVGFLDRIDVRHDTRYMVVDGKGQQFRANGFRRCEVIPKEIGDGLLKVGPPFEGLQIHPEVFNVWMLRDIFRSAMLKTGES